MFADGLGFPIRVAEASETGALGAALGAAIAVGEVSDYDEAVDRMTRTRSELAPDPDMRAHYEGRYEAYLNLTGRMRDFSMYLALRPTDRA